ncbi:DNA transposase THAP9 [Gonioctena quinquepunctata]|nr:DNA transposase THAP9 [Gonioctena quinquepunctata]
MVNLTVQTISASVADALEFLMVDVCDPNFAGAKATIEFIRIVDRAFDLLNARNPFGKGYKTPMKPETEKYGDSYLRRQLCI